MAELKYWVWLNELGLNADNARLVLSHFGGPKAAFFAEKADFAAIKDWTEKSLPEREINTLCNKNLSHVYRILDDMQTIGGRVLTQQDAEYPTRLRNTSGPPVVLYMRGRLPVVDEEAAVAIVGTRKCSA